MKGFTKVLEALLVVLPWGMYSFPGLGQPPLTVLHTGPPGGQKKDTVLAVLLPSSVNSLLGHRLPQIRIQVFLAFGP